MYIDKIENSNSFLEKTGDLLLSPARLFFGHTYQLEKGVLKEQEKFLSLSSAIARIASVALLPLSLISILFGLALKAAAYSMNPSLKERFSLPILRNARTEENFAGKLPSIPWTPNCVSSQQKSLWGKLYNADPIQMPPGTKNPIEKMKQVMQLKKGLLTEEREGYLHYEFTVVISEGPLKGTYTDDVDLYFNPENRTFDIRSASRAGLRDSIRFWDFSQIGANKRRIEAIRTELNNSQ